MEKLEELKMLLMEKKYLLIIGGVVILLILIFCLLFLKIQDKDDVIISDSLVSKEENILKEEEIIEECLAKVDIKGEIVNPGLYEVNCDSRVNDIINMAGGITDKGDTSVLNLGKKVKDEMVIIVYSKNEVTNFESVKEKEEKQIDECVNKTEIKNNACIEIPVSSVVTNSDNNSNSNNLDDNEIIGDTPVKLLVSLNSASKEELMTLSGIGESKANNIINYRSENGKFNTIEDIKNVKGIGDSIFEKIKNDITL